VQLGIDRCPYCRSTVKGILIEDLQELEVALPPLPEQQRIAGRLEQADRLRRTRRYALELSEGLLPAAFHGLSGDSTNGTTSFRQVAVGEVAERVVVGHVGETAEHYRESGVAFLRTQNVRRMSINREGMRYVTSDFAKRSRKSTLRYGDVVVSRVGANRGMAAVVPADLDGANCANILVVTPGSNLVPEYLAFLINSHQGLTELMGDSVGSAQGVINTHTLRTWVIPLPSQTRQREFAKLVERVGKLRSVQREALRQAEHLFASLLNHAFSG
jgi:type I restriction enzyme, S subunit